MTTTTATMPTVATTTTSRSSGGSQTTTTQATSRTPLASTTALNTSGSQSRHNSSQISQAYSNVISAMGNNTIDDLDPRTSYTGEAAVGFTYMYEKMEKLMSIVVSNLNVPQDVKDELLDFDVIKAVQKNQVLACIAAEKSKQAATLSDLPQLGNNDTGTIRAKDFSLFTTDGSKAPDKSGAEIICWLNRIGIACKGFTAEIWLNTIHRFADGALLESLLTWKRDGIVDPLDVINRVEYNFGKVLKPADALRRIGELRRRKDEPLHQLDTRISHLTAMAVRNMTEERRKIERERIAKSTLIRILADHIRLDLLEREATRIDSGKPEYSYRLAIDEVQNLEEK